MDKKQILLVEDNPDDRDLTKLALQDNGFDVDIIIAEDGEQALELLYGNNGSTNLTPDLVLLDLKLPKISGHEVLKQIRNHDATTHLPVVVLTTSVEDADMANSYDNGANSYIRKAVNYKEFVEHIGYIVNYWFICNQLPS